MAAQRGRRWAAVSDSTARLLAADADNRLYFRPTANFDGQANITFRAWDQSSGSDGGTANTTSNGGGTAFSTATDTATFDVTAVNDAPTSSNDLVTTSEDVTIVLGLGDFGTYADVEGSALAAVRITTLESNGALQYDTTGGGMWTDVTLNQQISASDISAGRVRFVPDATENGTPYATIGFQVSDGTDFSVSAYTLTVNVTGVNNAPVLDASKSPAGAAVAEDAAVPVGAVGTLVSALIDFASPSGQVDNVTDADAGALTGIAITAADTSNGSWFYSTNGTTWTALGALSDSTALLLAADADNRLYFRPNANYDGQANITFRAWDQSSGSDGGTANTTSNGSGTAFSTATDTASFDVTPVNDAPVISGDLTIGVVQGGRCSSTLSVSTLIFLPKILTTRQRTSLIPSTERRTATSLYRVIRAACLLILPRCHSPRPILRPGTCSS